MELLYKNCADSSPSARFARALSSPVFRRDIENTLALLGCARWPTSARSTSSAAAAQSP